MRKFIISFLIAISSLYSNELPKDMNSLDAYSEYTFKYYPESLNVKFYTLLRYQNNRYLNQFGFRDILLYSLKEVADEAKRLGYENFNIYFIPTEPRKTVSNVSIDEYLNNFNPAKANYIYPYNVGKKDGSGIGSVIALGANVALGATALKSGNASNVSSRADVFAHSVDGVMTEQSGRNIIKDATGTSIDNKIEIDSMNSNVFYNTIEQEVWFTYDKNFIYEHPNIIKFSVDEVDKYFEKNPYRIKELYTTKKHLITRGLKDE